MGERFTAPQGLGQGYWRAILRALEHYRMSSQVYSLGPPVHPLAQGWVISRPTKRMPESASSLTFQLMTTTPTFLNHFPKTTFLAVTGGQGPLWCWSIAEQDNEWSLIDTWLLVNGPSEAPSKPELHMLPRNRVGRNEAHQWLTA